MASDTLPVLSHSQFPQVFTKALDRMVERTYCPALLTSDSADEYGSICDAVVLPGHELCSHCEEILGVEIG